MSTAHVNSALVVSAYAAGESASALARTHGISIWAVLKRVRDAGVPVRTVKEQCEKHRGPPATDAYTFGEIVDGLLLGDAYIDRQGLIHLEQSDMRFGWIEQIASLLRDVGAESKIIPIPPKTRFIEGREVHSHAAHVLYTPAYVELQAERKRWYPEGKKVVPRDLRLTPMSVAHWFCGDGSSSPDGTLCFYTNGFLPDDVEFLVRCLRRDLGVHVHAGRSSREGQLKIMISQRDEAVRLQQAIGPLLPECCLYKLRYVRPTIPKNLHHQRKLTDEQVREIRRCYTAGETQKSLSARFGVRQSSISLIVRGKVYAWLDSE